MSLIPKPCVRSSSDPGPSVRPGDDAPDFAFTSASGQRHRLSDFRGSPVVVAFHGAHWDPARAEHVETYNRLVASLGGTAGAQLVEIGGNGPWHDLSFGDDSVALPVVNPVDADVAATCAWNSK